MQLVKFCTCASVVSVGGVGGWMIANNWWSRSPNVSNTTNFGNVNNNGNLNNNNASNTNGVVFGFSPVTVTMNKGEVIHGLRRRI